MRGERVSMALLINVSKGDVYESFPYDFFQGVQ